ncbi:hypothetical protein Moror_13491 [Moniliophthora roreri MCA 2997]|uniref:Uncharacterized protein n=2 Tax=Moniliophthora roreri TaxID=221103 RepID=V2WAL9_MONRO|nr:hypothetical protein Moror_13491 [Moniliophthora roreri MCA 2997]
MRMPSFSFHFLGDYAHSLRMYGTTDGYSSTISEVMHKVVKDFYEKTNKNNFEAQIVNHDQHSRELCKMSQWERALPNRDCRKIVEKEPLQMMGANDTIQITNGQCNHRSLSDFYDSNNYALQDFVDRLKEHLFNCVTKLEKTPELMWHMEIVGIDSINPSNHADIITLSFSAKKEGEHPYNYGHVCGIYHVVVHFHGDPKTCHPTKTKKYTFIWVHWYEMDRGGRYQSGIKSKCLHCLHFCDPDDSLAFEFLDPEFVIHGIHLLPSFKDGKDDRWVTLAVNSLAQQQKSRNSSGEKVLETTDWKYYYVNMFVDCDIFMRLCGGGIGHQLFWEYCDSLVHESGLEDQQEWLPVYNKNGEVMESEASRAEDSDDDKEQPANDRSMDDSDLDKDSINTQDPDSDDSDIEYIAHATV